MRWSEFVRLVRTDLDGYGESFIKSLFLIPGFKFTFHHRLCFYLSTHKLLCPLFVFQWLYVKHLTYLYGIQMSWNRNLPEHFVIAHFGGINFFPAECGSNVYLRQNVTVGENGKSKGSPVIGHHVEFGANVVVIGPIKIGNHVVIGAGSVVTKDVPDNVVVGGVPARVLHLVNMEEFHGREFDSLS